MKRGCKAPPNKHLKEIFVSLSLLRPTPYEKRGDMIVPMTPNHYVTLFYGMEQRNSLGEVIVNKNGQAMYRTERLYVSDGAVYTGENNPIHLSKLEELYPWFWDEYRKINPELRKAVKLILPEDRATTAEELDDNFMATWENLPQVVKDQLASQYAQPPVVQEETYTCPDCGEETPLRLKGIHRATKHKTQKA